MVDSAERRVRDRLPRRDEPARRQIGECAAADGAAGTQVNVFFEFDRSRLTREAQQIVAQIANQMQSHSLSATLIGKADLTGSDSYDLALGRRRADAVAQELARLGVARNRIAIDSAGKRQPPVKTADGVREPRNRVVEVTLEVGYLR